MNEHLELKCPLCGFVVAPERARCPACGETLPQSAKAPQDAATATPSVTGPALTTSPKQFSVTSMDTGRRRLAPVLAFLVVVSAASLSVYFAFRAKPPARLGADDLIVTPHAKPAPSKEPDFIDGLIDKHVGNQPSRPQQQARSPIAAPEKKPSTPPLSPEAVYQKAKGAVVVLRSLDGFGNTQATGSGFVVKPGIAVITNAHVITMAEDVEIKMLDGRSGRVAEALWVDVEGDLAVLPLPATLQGVEGLSLTFDDEVAVGEQVLALGAPKGMEFTMTSGIVSQIRDQRDGPRLIQTDASISPGSSGGPLLNRFGQVLGVTTSALVDANNLNFAIGQLGVLAFKIESQKDAGRTSLRKVAADNRHNREIDKAIEGVKKQIEGVKKVGKDDAGALRDFDEAIRLDPRNAKAYFFRGCVHYNRKENAEALRDLDMAIQIDQTQWDFYYQRGISRAKFVNYAGAIEDFNSAIKLNPRVPDPWVQRAHVRSRQGDNAGCLRDALKALELDPNCVEASQTANAAREVLELQAKLNQMDEDRRKAAAQRVAAAQKAFAAEQKAEAKRVAAA